jgi:hypothetical protein
MEQGHLPDIGHGVVVQTSWAAGIPEPRKIIGGVKYDKKAQTPVIAWRCERCGFVELYAGEP